MAQDHTTENMSKLILTFQSPDYETMQFAAAKIRDAYLGELDKAMKKAQVAIAQNKRAKIKTKPLTIEITPKE